MRCPLDRRRFFEKALVEEKSSTIIFPVPIDIFKALMRKGDE